MGKHCMVCDDPRADAINADIMAGLSIRLLSDKYGINKTSIGRHRIHTRDQLPGAPDVEVDPDGDITTAVGSNNLLLRKLDRMFKNMETIYRAKKTPAYTKVAAVSEMRAVLVLLDKATDRQFAKEAITNTDADKLKVQLAEASGKINNGVAWVKELHPGELESYCSHVDGITRFPLRVIRTEGGGDGRQVSST